jgi:PAS domain S-box-containing protein
MAEKVTPTLVGQEVEAAVLQRVLEFTEELRQAQASGDWDDILDKFTERAREIAGGLHANLILWAEGGSMVPAQVAVATEHAPSTDFGSPNSRPGYGLDPASRHDELRYELEWQGVRLGILTIHSPSLLVPPALSALKMIDIVIDQFCAYWGSHIQTQLHNRRLHHVESLELVQDIGDLLTTSLDVDAVLRNITDTLQAMLKAEICSVLVYEAEADAFRCVSRSHPQNLPLPDVLIPAGASLVGWLARQAAVVHLEDVTRHPAFNREFESLPDIQWHDLLAVPLRYRDEVIGVIKLANKIGGHFDDLDAQLLQRVAPGAAIALENARLFGKLDEEKQKAELVLQHISRGVCVLDRQGCILMLNPAAEEILAHRENQVVGCKLCELLPSDELAPQCPGLVDCPICREIRGGMTESVVEQDLILVRDDAAEYRLNISIAPLVSADARRRGAVVVLKDVTPEWEEKRLQVEFVAVASHGLRSPLMSITTAAEWVLARSDLAQAAQERIREIQKQAFTLSEFVGELLDVSQIEAGQLRIYAEPVSMLPFARQAVKTFRIRAPDHNIRLVAPPSLPFVLADANKLDIILDHLLDNAVHYSPVGSEIIVEIEALEENAKIRVIDQGEGIPADDLPQIFDAFNRGARRRERKTKGLGLGLYIVSRLVEGHNGTISVESEAGKGSMFTFTLPWFDQEVTD